MRRFLIPATVVAVAGLLAACGDDTTSVGSGPQSRPTGADEVVVQVLVDGGFVPVSFAVSTVPTFTLLGDGTAITGGATLAIYPGPAVQPLQSVKIDEEEIDALLDKADELGLLSEPLDFGQPPVADAPNTTVTIVVGGTTYTHSANALGIGDELQGGDPSSLGMSEEQVENRRALSAFVAATEALPPGEEIWTPDEVAVFDLGDYTGDPELAQEPVDWPLPEAPELSSANTAFACTLVTGTDAETLLAALEGANSLTPWVIDDQQHSLAFRPVIPGHKACE